MCGHDVRTGKWAYLGLDGARGEPLWLPPYGNPEWTFYMVLRTPTTISCGGTGTRLSLALAKLREK